MQQLKVSSEPSVGVLRKPTPPPSASGSPSGGREGGEPSLSELVSAPAWGWCIPPHSGLH